MKSRVSAMAMSEAAIDDETVQAGKRIQKEQHRGWTLRNAGFRGQVEEREAVERIWRGNENEVPEPKGGECPEGEI